MVPVLPGRSELPGTPGRPRRGAEGTLGLVMFVTSGERRILRSAFAEWGFELTGGENGEPLEATRTPRH